VYHGRIPRRRTDPPYVRIDPRGRSPGAASYGFPESLSHSAARLSGHTFVGIHGK
jgi:hypothetical protein